MIKVVTGGDSLRKKQFIMKHVDKNTHLEIDFFGDYDINHLGVKPIFLAKKVLWLQDIPVAKFEKLMKVAESYDTSFLTAFFDVADYDGEAEVFGEMPKADKRLLIKNLFDPKKGEIQFTGTRGEKRKFFDLIVRNTSEFLEPLTIELKKLSFLFKKMNLDQAKLVFSEDEFLLVAIYEFLMEPSMANRVRLYNLHESQGDSFKFMLIREVEEIFKYKLFGEDVIKSQFKQRWYKNLKVDVKQVISWAELFIEPTPFEQLLWDFENKLAV